MFGKRCAPALGLVGLALLLAPRAARATPSLTISAKASLSGEHVYDKLTIAKGGELSVAPLGPGGSGLLHIKANQIVIEQGGTITATGSGYPGINDADGGAAMGSNGGGKHPSTNGLPGGGGGFGGKGAGGTSDAMLCAAYAGSAGGAAFFMPMTPAMTPDLGSAGGAANVSGAATTAGGRGGGVIVLEAATITIDGTLEANGSPSFAQSGVAPGAGSGGAIQIVAGKLAGSGTLSVVGGAGAHGGGNAAQGIPANNGGGGGGGVILLSAQSIPMSLVRMLDPGGTGNCMGDATAGQIVEDANPTACVDADGDMHPSSACGGDDCDDSDAAIYPGNMATEVCDGLDNDCNGSVDDGAKCAAGSICDSAARACVPESDAGTGTGGGAGTGGGDTARPDHVGFEGGCGVAQGAAASSAFALALALSALGLGARRRRIKDG